MPQPRTAVVIEDDADIGHLVHAILGGARVSAQLRATGTQGIAAVRELSPDMVILDYGLPDITGLEVLRRIRRFSSVYILMLTGHADLCEELISAGANNVMTKPFRPRTLRSRIEEILTSE
jgi:two-component system OmpR family response regulator